MPSARLRKRDGAGQTGAAESRVHPHRRQKRPKQKGARSKVPAREVGSATRKPQPVRGLAEDAREIQHCDFVQVVSRLKTRSASAARASALGACTCAEAIGHAADAVPPPTPTCCCPYPSPYRTHSPPPQPARAGAGASGAAGRGRRGAAQVECRGRAAGRGGAGAASRMRVARGGHAVSRAAP